MFQKHLRLPNTETFQEFMAVFNLDCKSSLHHIRLSNINFSFWPKKKKEKQKKYNPPHPTPPHNSISIYYPPPKKKKKKTLTGQVWRVWSLALCTQFPWQYLKNLLKH